MPSRLRRSLFWASCYFISIPVYAAIYNAMPQQFYAPYARLEQGSIMDQDAILAGFARSFYRGISSHSSAALLGTVGDGEDGRIEARFTNFSVADGFIKAHLNIDFYPNGDTTNGFFVVSYSPVFSGFIEFRIAKLFAVVYLKDGDRVIHYYHSVKLSQEEDETFTGNKPFATAVSLFRPYLDRWTANHFSKSYQSGSSILILLEMEEQLITNFLLGYNGDPTYLSQSYLRMLYFSAISITTIGFGDIVPMTALARILVGSEAIFGIVMGGLFIAALTAKEP